MSTVRRTRPPPPTPRILNLPRRIRRKNAKQLAGKPDSSPRSGSRGKLESLFDQERAFAGSIPMVLLNAQDSERRERVEDGDRGRDTDEEDKWRFQAEILRAECNFLRMERDIAVKKLELNRIQTKPSAVQTLVSGKEKSMSFVSLEEEIEHLQDKLKGIYKCSNFDTQACVLQRKLQGLLAQEKCLVEIPDQPNRFKDETKSKEDKGCSGRCKRIVRKIVEQVRAEMEQWSLMQEMLERVREEMEDLQCSRDFWQDRSLDSDQQLQTLKLSVQEWKQEARRAENKVAKLEKHNSELNLKLQRLKNEKKNDTLKEKEKHVLICRLKENHHHRHGNDKQQKELGGGSSNGIPKRSPLRAIPNSSHLPWEKQFRAPFVMN